MRALMSLQQIYPRRALTAEEWRSAQMLSLLADSTRIMSPAQIDTVSRNSLLPVCLLIKH